MLCPGKWLYNGYLTAIRDEKKGHTLGVPFLDTNNLEAKWVIPFP